MTEVTGPARYRIYFAVRDAVLQSLATNYTIVKAVNSALEYGAADVSESFSRLQMAKKNRLNREKP